MAAFNGCKGTLKYGSAPTELLGLKNWNLSETTNSEDYQDNTTGCDADINVTSVISTVTFDVNLQSGASKGKLPFRPPQQVELQLHIDDTDANYFSGTAIVTELGNYLVSPENGALVSVSYTARFRGRPVGNGTLEDEIS